jgi:hypothetical protein
VDHTKPDATYLISPPEERRMFLSKAFITFRTFQVRPCIHTSGWTIRQGATNHFSRCLCPCAYISQAATIARQVVHMQLAGHMAISEAPEPTDVTWINMYTTRTGQVCV